MVLTDSLIFRPEDIHLHNNVKKIRQVCTHLTSKQLGYKLNEYEILFSNLLQS